MENSGEGTEQGSELEKIKKLALGKDYGGAPSKKSAPFGEKNNAFEREQKIFTQISSAKELSAEPSYGVPGSIIKGGTESKKNESAFEQLRGLASSETGFNAKDESVEGNRDIKQQMVQQKAVTKAVASGKGVSMKSSADESPSIKQTATEQNKPKESEWLKGLEKRMEESYTSVEKNAPTVAAKTSPEDGKQNKTPETGKVRTTIDGLFSMLEKTGKVDLGEAAAVLGTDYETMEKIARMFESDGVLELTYPTSFTKKPTAALKNPISGGMIEKPKGQLLDSYQMTVDEVAATVSIIMSIGEARPIYSIELPSIGKYTRRFLSFVKEEVAETMPIELEEIVDPKKSKQLKEKFFEELNEHLRKYFPQAKLELLNTLSGTLLHEMYGLGDIELLMGDDMLEEVSINSAKTPITVYHRVHGWLKTNLLPGTEEEINNFASQIGRKVGREITVLNPILDAHLLSGDRVNATLFPISAEGNTITIRRFARKPWTIVDFIGKAHTMNAEMAALLWLAMQYEMNILIAGGTASGKTSALNSLLALVPTYHRIISIEDVREIVLPKYLEWNWVPMVTRSKNPEGLGEVTMLDLMVTSLRMRPDRIIVGEIRRKKEAETLMEAIETGHSIYSTLHANSAYQVLRRLAEAPISIPLVQIELIDIIVVQYRDRKTNRRRTFEIAEIEQTSTGQGLQINTIYKWSPRTDNWERLNKPTKIITLLNVHTGMTEEEISSEVEQRKQILEWMRKAGISELDMIGYLVKTYYFDPKKVFELAKSGAGRETIAEMMLQEPGLEGTPKA